MAKQYENLCSILQNHHQEILERATSEIVEMLTKMGMKENEWMDLPKSRRFFKVTFRKETNEGRISFNGYIICTIAPQHGGEANYHETSDADTIVTLHYEVRHIYNKYMKTKKLH